MPITMETTDKSQLSHGYWSTTRAAAYLDLSEVALRERVRRGQLRCVRLGRTLRFRRADLDAVLCSAAPRSAD